MPRKMAKSAPTTNVRAVRGAGCRLHLVSPLQEGRKSPNIHARSRAIRGIPFYMRHAGSVDAAPAGNGGAHATGVVRLPHCPGRTPKRR
jgi:hypothetical protein